MPKAAAPERLHVDLLGNQIARPVRPTRAFIARLFKEVLQGITLDEFAHLLSDRFRDAQEYLELMEDGKTCQRMSLHFNPHRLDTKAAQYKNAATLYEAVSTGRGSAKSAPDAFYDGLARAYLSGMQDIHGRNLLYSLMGMGVQGTYYVNEFPPHVARDIYREFGMGKDSRILDPCAGWGGRMIGASVVSNHYDGCEPSVLTATGLGHLAADLKAKTDGAFIARVACKPFEDAKLSVESYDIALTSPPYYDTELYADEETQSYVRYKTFDDWLTGFYYPLIDRTLLALKPGAPFILNVGDRRYPLASKLYEHADEIGARVKVLPPRVTGRLPGAKDADRDSTALARGSGLRGKGEKAKAAAARGEAFYVVTLDAR